MMLRSSGWLWLACFWPVRLIEKAAWQQQWDVMGLFSQSAYYMLLAPGHSSMHGFPTTRGSGEKELNPAVVLNPRTIAQISYLYTRTLSSS